MDCFNWSAWGVFMFAQQKSIIIIGAGVLQVPAIKIARELNLFSIVFDYNKEALGMKLADLPVIASTRDIDGCVRAAKAVAKNHKIDAVITVGTDASSTVAAVQAALDLPGNRFEDAYAATNKIKMRQRFAEHNVPQPDFYPVWTYADALEAFNKLPKPVVVKPVDNMGSRGCMKIENEAALQNGFNRAKSASISGEVILEEYMDGPELSIDMLIHDGEIYVTGIADRIIEYPPFFIETGHIMPSSLPQDQLDNAIDVMKQGIRALNLKMGAAKGDIKVTKDGAKVGEIAARLSGGFMSAFTFPLSSGVNVIKNAIEISLGMPPSDLKPKWNKVAIEKAFLPGSGIVESIEGLDEALSIDGVKEIFLRAKVGDILANPTNNLEKAGNVITVADTRDEAIAIANKVIDTIKIKLTTHKSLTLEEIKRSAKERFGGVCEYCSICGGVYLIGGSHGCTCGQSFIRNVSALNSYLLSPNMIHEPLKINIERDFFGSHIEAPIAIASISNVESLGGIISRREYYTDVINASINSGIISIFHDNGVDEDYEDLLDIISSNPTAVSVVILKPIHSQPILIKRLKDAQKAGANVVGIDIEPDFDDGHRASSISHSLSAKSKKDISDLVASVDIPFIAKGVMSMADALSCAEAGVDVLYVSNKGGRSMKSMSATIDVLYNISEVVKSKYSNIKIICDGGFRDGEDILKGYILGADIVGVGRPFLISAFGKGNKGIEYRTSLFIDEIKRAMSCVGLSSVDNIDSIEKLLSKNM